jgi:alcohol dehydrogenase
MDLKSLDYQPITRVVFGAGSLARLGELTRELGVRRALVVSDRGVIAAGHTGRGVESLERAGFEVFLFAGVEENPTTRHVRAGVELARSRRPDCIVGLGGGSSMDCAKGVNFILSCGGEMQDFWGIGKATRPLLPMVAVPTTAGTGSETQSFALIADETTHQKMACGDKKAAFKLAVLDPETTLTQPPRVTAATGIDAVAHAVETFVTRRQSPVSRAFASEAWRLLESSYERVIAAPGDIEARGAMQLGAMLAGCAIENSMLGAAHAAANPLTARFGVVHGAAVGVMLPHVVRWNTPVVEDGYRDLLRLSRCDEAALAAATAEDLALRLEALLDASGLAPRLEEWGVERGALPRLAEEAAAQWTAKFNPRTVGAGDFLALYEVAY